MLLLQISICYLEYNYKYGYLPNSYQSYVFVLCSCTVLYCMSLRVGICPLE